MSCAALCEVFLGVLILSVRASGIVSPCFPAFSIRLLRRHQKLLIDLLSTVVAGSNPEVRRITGRKQQQVPVHVFRAWNEEVCIWSQGVSIWMQIGAGSWKPCIPQCRNIHVL